MRFSNKNIFITGASSGIGEALARELFAEGANLILAARRVDRLKNLSSNLSRPNQKILYYSCDVARDCDLPSVMESGAKELGKIDIAIANAGFGVVGKVEDLSLDDYRRQFETNVYGVLRTYYAALPYLKQSKGTFVLTGSIAGYVSLYAASAYCMSKFAVHALADSLRFELKPYDVSVVHICPGFVESEIRKVNNQGVIKEHSADTKYNWLRMPTDKAARQMVRAIYFKRREVVITGHGKILVWMKRYFPRTLEFLFSFFSVRGRHES